jgi:hypothetical protein
MSQFFCTVLSKGYEFHPYPPEIQKLGIVVSNAIPSLPMPAVASAVTAATKPCSCHESREPLVIPKDTSHEDEPRDNEERRQQFEFTYDVRHNYLLSGRLEGERVIRPIRFSCTLDFFAQAQDESSWVPSSCSRIGKAS